ncbi:3-isopropylmalate dehydratase small subunit [Thermotoga sp. SG1]|uniref:3-isopropylmalate dehydratase small subunit n=1 Tax=Thermotoga sp. SG1 TaxID=126739 RepID=UPI000C770D19|nr:3-isopropylmalate dehydratase small subunit [Thermotoga sp. SG1]PLV57024.1 3-isopropylmalate dehydratase small subunit [Thermotoga sp. SG1]
MKMKIRGKVFVFGDNVNTDEIIPARYLNTSDPQELAKYCMEDARPGFGRRDDIKGSIIVAGENFGCGSSREHAPVAIKAAGISCVIAKSFARIFFRNAINIGLPIVELKEADEFEEGDIAEVDLENGVVRNFSKAKEYRIRPYPEFLMKIMNAGGWLEYCLKEMGE